MDDCTDIFLFYAHFVCKWGDVIQAMPFVRIKNGIVHSVKMEFNLNFHCNFRCAECSRNSPYVQPQFASLKSFKKDVKSLSKVYHVRRFRFEGGEPLLNKNILLFLDVVRNSSIADQLHVHTNGALLNRADEALFREIDILTISRYPDPLCNESKIQKARKLCRRYGTKLRIDPIRSFRRINVDKATGSHLAQKIFDSCQIVHSWYCQTFFNGRFYLCSRPLSTQMYRQKKGLNSPDFAMLDGIDIHSENLFERLRDYFRKHEPLLSCSHCLGSVGLHKAWRSLSVDECRHPEIIQELTENLIDHRRLMYLYIWEHIQRRFLRLLPFLPVARILTMLRDVSFFRSRNKLHNLDS